MAMAMILTYSCRLICVFCVLSISSIYFMYIPFTYYRWEDIILKTEISNYKNKWRRVKCSETNYLPFD